MKGDLTVLAGLLGIWCFFHSLLIAPPVTSRFRKWLGRHFRWFRLSYNLFAVATLLPIIVWSRQLPCREDILSWEGPWVVVQVAMWVSAAGLFWGGAKVYPMAEFTGVGHLVGRPKGQEVLVKKGVLSVVRHPWYAGALLVLWGRDLCAPALVTAAVFSLYLMIGYRLEERKLKAEFGAAYIRYQEEVSALFPYKWLRGRHSHRS